VTTTRKSVVRFAFKTANQYNTWADVLAVWKEADDVDLFESGWLFDHFYPIWSPQKEADVTGPCLEGWTMLAALAQATTRLRMGTLVTGIHYRHPAVLAKMVATIDLISGGRIELGIGAGWNTQESGAYGIELGSLRERFDRFDEACQVIISLLSEETTNFAGSYYRLSDARCEPKGPQTPHPPIVIGGAGEKRTLRAVARYAQQWDASNATSPEALAHKLEVLRGHCDDIGRDPREIATSNHLWFDPAESEVGSIAEQASRLASHGIDIAIIYLAPPLSPAVLAPLAEALAPLR
jgi:F420-dependent oxidoreductase-like protein